VTETEVYEVLGWPTSGEGLILPTAGSLSTLWCAVFCDPCNWRGISAPHLLEVGCPGCGKPWMRIEREAPCKKQ
jgi:hypothetical protein